MTLVGFVLVIGAIGARLASRRVRVAMSATLMTGAAFTSGLAPGFAPGFAMTRLMALRTPSAIGMIGGAVGVLQTAFRRPWAIGAVVSGRGGNNNGIDCCSGRHSKYESGNSL